MLSSLVNFFFLFAVYFVSLLLSSRFLGGKCHILCPLEKLTGRRAELLVVCVTGGGSGGAKVRR